MQAGLKVKRNTWDYTKFQGKKNRLVRWILYLSCSKWAVLRTHMWTHNSTLHLPSHTHTLCKQVTVSIAAAAISQEQTRWEESRWLSFASSWPSALGSSSSSAVTISSADLAMSSRQEWGGEETSFWLLNFCLPVKWWSRIKILQLMIHLEGKNAAFLPCPPLSPAQNSLLKKPLKGWTANSRNFH